MQTTSLSPEKNKESRTLAYILTDKNLVQNSVEKY